jgi:hypothetical protein
MFKKMSTALTKAQILFTFNFFYSKEVSRIRTNLCGSDSDPIKMY